MRKISIVLSIIIILILCSTSVAAQSAFTPIIIHGTNPDVTLIADHDYLRWGLAINWWGPEGEWDGASALTSEHTAGGAYKNDVIRIENVDFGVNGASAVTLNVSNGDDSTQPTLGVFVGGVRVATIIGEFTGSWDDGADRTAAITADVTGIQTVEVQFMMEGDDMSSGTVFSVLFAEKPPAPTEPEAAPIEEEPQAQEDIPAVIPDSAPAPYTNDNFGFLVFAISFAGVAAALAVKRKAKNI